MKTFILLMLLAVSASAQSGFTKKVEPVEVSEVKIAGASQGWVLYYPEYKTYTVSFRNMEYSTIFDSKYFMLSLEEYEELKAAIKDNFGTTTKLEKILSDNQRLTIEFSRNTVQFWLYNLGSLSYSTRFTQSQITKLLPNHSVD
jgi:hypothetical protein